MNLGSIIESGFKEIWAHWFRSLLTMFGIILGVASLVTMSAFVKGKENLLRDSLAESGGLERIIVDDDDDLPDYQKHLEDEANGVTLKDVLNGEIQALSGPYLTIFIISILTIFGLAGLDIIIR